MRRWFASVLLLLTALLPLQPLIASAQAEASLPACCRRNGVHHCTMLRTTMSADASKPLSIGAAPCPLCNIAMSPAVVAVAATPPSLSSEPALAEDVVVPAPAVLFVRFARSRSARAPPFAPFPTASFSA